MFILKSAILVIINTTAHKITLFIPQLFNSLSTMSCFPYFKSFIACALGIENIGYVMICYGITDAVCSLSFGRLVQFVGHVPFFALGEISFLI